MRRRRKEGQENPSFPGNSSIPQLFSFKNADSWHQFLLIQKKSCLVFLLNSSTPAAFVTAEIPSSPSRPPNTKVNQGCVCQQNTTSASEFLKKTNERPSSVPEQAASSCWHQAPAFPEIPQEQLHPVRAHHGFESWRLTSNDRKLLPSLPFVDSFFGKNAVFLLSWASRESCWEKLRANPNSLPWIKDWVLDFLSLQGERST